MGTVGLLYEYFTAADDQAATGMLTTGWPPPTFRDEGIAPRELAGLEALLTGRDVQEVAADPRLGAQLAELVDEGAGVAECGVLTVPDTLTAALATADAGALSAAGAAWGDDMAVRELAAIARHAAQHGHRLYCLWMV
jgi:hypothetical protein